ncbi:MAG: hypothetical protein ABSF26_09995 [Thermoguttaceae bacterium]
MSTKRFFEKICLVAVVAVALAGSPALAAHGGGGGGGGGGHGGGGWGGGHSGSGWSGGHAASGWSGGHSGSWNGSNWSGHGNMSPYSAHMPNAWTSHEWDHHFTGHSGWDHHGDWWGHHHGFYPFYGGFWPWWGWGLGLGLDWWGFGYPYYYYNDYPSYCFVYPDSGTTTAYSPYSYSTSMTNVTPPESTPEAANAEGPSEALQYYTEARSAFASGDYRNALRLAGHSAVEAPQNAKVHELISLALFALDDYRAAATEAHAAMALGPMADWNTLYGYYGDASKYTNQLRALEKSVASAPNSAAGRFLLAYHYLMTGAKDNAKTELTEAVKLTPQDKLAAHFLKQIKANEPLSPPPMPTGPAPVGHAL